MPNAAFSGANQNKNKQNKPVNMGKEVYVKTVILIIFFKYYELFIPYSADLTPPPPPRAKLCS